MTTKSIGQLRNEMIDIEEWAARVRTLLRRRPRNPYRDDHLLAELKSARLSLTAAKNALDDAENAS